MDIRNRSALKQSAAQALSAAPYDPRKLVLIHTGAVAVFSLLLAALDFLLENQISGTGGLSGMGTRSILSTAQSVLTLLQMAAVPFWQLGYLFTAMRMARRQPAQPRALLEGFRQFGPLLRTLLLQCVIYLGIGLASYFLCIQIYMMTPWANALYDLLFPMMESTTVMSGNLVLDDATLLALLDAMLPAFILWLAVFGVLACILSYQLRMMNYALLDDPKAGAFAALRASRRMTKGSRTALFKLDLSFWWFYGLELLLSVLCYGDVILELLGVTLPFSGTVGYFLFYTLYLAGQIVLYLWRKNHVEVTYALAYDSLRELPPQTPAPQKHPWQE